MDYGDTIRSARERLGISAGAAAEYVGINDNHYWDLEAFDEELRMTLSLAEFSRLCGLLRLTPHGLLGEKPPQRHITPVELRERVLQDCRSRRWSVEQFGENAGWNVQKLVDDPAAASEWNLDCLEDVCAALGVAWIEAVPEPRAL